MMSDPMQLAELAVLCLGGGALTLWVIRNARRKARHRRAWLRGEGARQGKPDTVHPRVDHHRCICSGACVSACPEKDVLGFIDGKLTLLDSSRCIGHGDCIRSCPVDALTLVIGSADRGVELPVLGSDFATSVPGIYVAGELGGMGLIHNAVSQGVQAMRAIGESLAMEAFTPSAEFDVVDVVIVGAGPAGLAAALQAKSQKLRYALFEQGEHGGAVRSFPRQKIVMTAPAVLPLYGKVKLSRTTKEELLALWEEVIAQTGLEVRSGVRVLGGRVEPEGVFTLQTSLGDKRARRVLLAIGRRGTPRRLGVEGESASKVTYQLTDAAQYAGMRCIVVGGGDSALETALMLSEQSGTQVTLCIKTDRINRGKAENQANVNAAAEQGRIDLRATTEIARIREDSVDLRRDGVADVESIANDYVFVCIGGELPTAYLRSFGIAVRTLHGEPLVPAS